MSGVTAIRYLLANAASITPTVPAARIFAGRIPLKTPLPAIAVTMISGTPRNTTSMLEVVRLMTDRVQVTVQAARYDTVKDMLERVRKACPNQAGSVGGVTLCSILPDVVGPDLYDHTAAIESQSRDFIVQWKTRAGGIALEGGVGGDVGLEGGGIVSLESEP